MSSVAIACLWYLCSITNPPHEPQSYISVMQPIAAPARPAAVVPFEQQLTICGFQEQSVQNHWHARLTAMQALQAQSWALASQLRSDQQLQLEASS